MNFSQSQKPYLTLEKVSKSYLEGNHLRIVLNQVSIQINKGEFIAILGKSGSGKTTLLNLISGIDRVDKGKISLNDHVLTNMDDHTSTLFRRRNIGFIFQFFNLISTLNVWENVTMPLELNGLMDDIHQANARILLDEVGLSDRMKTYPDRLSGGEQQRVAIARALVHNPMLVLADEPTGNLDESTGKHVLELLDRLTRRAGKNLILVTHSPEAASYADRLFILSDGKLDERLDE